MRLLSLLVVAMVVSVGCNRLNPSETAAAASSSTSPEKEKVVKILPHNLTNGVADNKLLIGRLIELETTVQAVGFSAIRDKFAVHLGTNQGSIHCFFSVDPKIKEGQKIKVVGRVERFNFNQDSRAVDREINLVECYLSK